MDWAKSTESRDQLVLFPTRLDDAIEANHRVRLLDDILGHLDWSAWEASYQLTRGQPPIHPRIIAGVILYGLLTRIRSSRALEEALTVRLDFRWLVEGRSIDHTTISEFRRKNSDGLQSLFVQVVLLAREMGCLTLTSLAFDGTRIRASNCRGAARTPERLQEMKAELATKFAELEAKTVAMDTQEEESLGDRSLHELSDELSDVKRRRAKVDAALAELERIETAGQKVPKYLPTTDPESRVLPNKEGGYAPNYTPLAMMDVDSGLIVSADVIPSTDEDKYLIPAIDDVQEQFDLPAAPPAVLADGLMATGDNLAACEARGITLYSPISGSNNANNPAIRDDPSQPVAVEDRTRLPTKTYTQKGTKLNS